MSFGIFRLAPLLATLVVASACVTPPGDTAQSQRQTVQNMREDTLAKLYRIRPGTKALLRRAAGYAVFSNVNVNLVLLSAGSGWGVARDNRTGRDVYMKMGSAGVGIGLGVKDFRGVFVFTTQSALRQFVDSGWDASAQADAAAKTGRQGGALSGAIDVAPGVKLYQITEHGLALQATIQGTKFWKDDELNSAP
jgi:lipid-binding SYLF domain-containing protein